MIGQFPSRLSYSLYSTFYYQSIMANCKEKNVINEFLKIYYMKSFAGSPYIDIEKLKLSLLPRNLNKKVSEELIDKTFF